MPRPSRSPQIDLALLVAVREHPTDLVARVATDLGLSRSAVSARVRQLVEDDFLTRAGSTRPVYGIGLNRREVFRFARQGLAEDLVWTRSVAPLLTGVPDNVFEIAQYGLTEMVNNAVDHSEGTMVAVSVIRDREKLSLAVMDDGVGIFDKIANALALPDKRMALLELSKGKFTTDPDRHSGEGIFFTSRMFDRFSIVSGGLVFDHLDGEDDYLFEREWVPGAVNTHVMMDIAVHATRKCAEVFKEFSSGPDEYSFAKTIIPVRLAKIGRENLVSRSQAKRLLQGIDRFRTVVLDFEGVDAIGQAFADEIFRVFANAHSEIEIIAMHALPDVQQMIRRAEVLRDENAMQPR